MPTDLAIGLEGRVYVADGVNDRVVVFDADGAPLLELGTFGDDALSRPLSVATDAQGRVYVADTGNQRIVVFDSAGDYDHMMAAPTSSDDERTDITGVAVEPGGRTLWAADNDHDRLLRLDVASDTWRQFGESGSSLGQFSYPFFLAGTPRGDILVTDVINARVQSISDEGIPVRTIGTYGLRAGQLYRPKGVTVGPEGLVWVSDSVMGVVEAYTSDGIARGVLRDADGAPLRFAEPMGMAFDDAGALYVVEFGADRVAKVEIDRNPEAPPLPTYRTRVVDQSQAQSCTACHLVWMPDFDDPDAQTLIPRPDDSADDPLVARSETCRSCHDGSVVDSRRRVWQEHGHRTGIVPPPNITVPPQLPLIDGKVACRTCHSAHGSSAAMGDLKRTIILRVPNPASELCMSCHKDKVGGPRYGTHPTGGMPWAVPAALVKAGAKVGPNPRELTCQVCHTPHGAQHDHLLVMGASTNQLCLTCHDQMRPGMFRDDSHSEHPLNPKVNAEQRAAVKALGTKLSADGRLICLSCHKLHHGHGQRFLLADDLSNGQMCLRCHSQRAAMLGSAHDLRTNRPDEVNRLGMTPVTGGPCSACHLFHRYARDVTPAPPDMTGQCVTCHAKGRCAESKSLGPINHPKETCLNCHNPHETRFGHFLSSKNVCINCHDDKTTIDNGPHDAVTAKLAWSRADADASTNACLACHRPHGDPEHGLWRQAPADLKDPDSVCIACHEGAAWESPHPMAALHPRLADEASIASGLPLLGGDQSSGERSGAAGAARIGCRTCHDPHAGPMSAAHLLRAPPHESEQVCLRCHTDMRQITVTPHSASNMLGEGLAAETCGPCHHPHGDPADVQRDYLWSCDLLEANAKAEEPAAPAGGVPITDPYCSGCHHPGGVAPMPPVAWHPEAIMYDPSGNLPLKSGERLSDSAHMLSCRTCHLPHGRTIVPGAAEGPIQEERLLLRQFEAPNVCTTCHGAEALSRFLYFHDARQRAQFGPVGP